MTIVDTIAESDGSFAALSLGPLVVARSEP